MENFCRVQLTYSFPCIEEWTEGQISGNTKGVHIYTGGSKWEIGTEVGVFCNHSNNQGSVKLYDYNSVVHTEILEVTKGDK